jgi:PIN domain nuclease of toxin-antitoxin system
MILLDTHIWIRWLEPDFDPLPEAISKLIDCSNQVAVSAVSCWEVAYLVKRNRIKLSLPIEKWLQAALDESGVIWQSLTASMASRAANLTDIHRDTAGKFIIATAIELGATLPTLDSYIRDYPELAASLL